MPEDNQGDPWGDSISKFSNAILVFKWNFHMQSLQWVKSSLSESDHMMHTILSIISSLVQFIDSSAAFIHPSHWRYVRVFFFCYWWRTREPFFPHNRSYLFHLPSPLAVHSAKVFTFFSTHRLFGILLLSIELFEWLPSIYNIYIYSPPVQILYFIVKDKC